MTWSPTVTGRDLNPGPLSLKESALLTEITRQDMEGMYQCKSLGDIYLCGTGDIYQYKSMGDIYQCKAMGTFTNVKPWGHLPM